MSTVTLPPTGAKIRVTTTYPDGTTFSLEGIVAEHDAGRYRVPVATVGEKKLVAYLEDNDGAKVTVEVLDPPPPPVLPEPVDGTVLLCSRFLHGAVRPSMEQAGLLWRDDALEVNSDSHRWFRSFDGANVAYRWSEVLPEPGEWRVRMVPDPAAAAPPLPWKVTDAEGDLLIVDRWGDNSNPWSQTSGLFIRTGRYDGPNATQSLSAVQCREMAAVLLASAADQEAAGR